MLVNYTHDSKLLEWMRMNQYNTE